jgi:C_GCAxxG_C_C family probable redox protein
LKQASPFGGGVAHHRSYREHAGARWQGEVCGAVSGALMALGLARGNTTPEKKDETYRIAEEFIERFQELHESILCRELIGLDISTPDGLQNGKESGVFKSICPGLVEDAAELVAEFLDEQKNTSS